MSQTIDALTPATSPTYVQKTDIFPIQRAGYTYSAFINYGTGPNCTIQLDNTAAMPAVNADTTTVTNPVTSDRTTLLEALADINDTFTLPWGISQGGTGATTQQGALDNLAGAVTNHFFICGNGTHVTYRAIIASDIPTLNQNTTGNAATATNATNATTATNIAGGATESIPVQSGTGTTGMLATANDSLLSTDNTGVVSWIPKSSVIIPSKTAFTPIDTSAGGLTFASSAGFYSKIGNLVFVQINITYPSTADTNIAMIGVLPFTASAAGTFGVLNGADNGGSVICAIIPSGSTSMGIYLSSSLATVTNIQLSGLQVTLSGYYFI